MSNNQKSKVKREEWEKRYETAKRFMEERGKIKKVLIEVSAQHPLNKREEPNKEFKNRLLFGKEIYLRERQNGMNAEIYVPGSRHMHKGIADKISLSEAGNIFFLKQGIPREIIHGDDLNKKYKGEKGVYNSADECFVSTSYFKDEIFGKLYCVLSPLQIYRKALHYIWFGVLPLFYTAPTQKTFHNYIKEIYEFIPYVRDIDPEMQSKNSFLANLWRKERVPKN